MFGSKGGIAAAQNKNPGRLAVYYAASFFQGISLIILPGASFFFKSPSGNALSDGQYGLLFLPFIGVTIFLTAVLEKLLSRWKEKTVYYAGLFCNAAYFVFLFALTGTTGDGVTSFRVFFAAEVFLGAGFGLLIAVLNILAVDYDPGRRDSLLSGLHGCLGAGAALCPLLIHYFQASGQWPLFICLCGGGYILLGVISGLSGAGSKTEFRRDPNPESSAVRPDPGPMAVGGWFFVLAIVFYGITESVIGNWTASYLAGTKRFSSQTVSYALACFWGSVTAGRLLGSVLTRWMDSRILYRLLGPIVFLSLLVILRTSAEERILPGYILLGLGCSCFFPLSVGLSTRYFDRWRDRLSGYMTGGLMAGVGIGSTLFGVFAEQGFLGFRGIFLLAACSAAVFSVKAVLLTRQDVELSDERNK